MVPGPWYAFRSDRTIAPQIQIHPSGTPGATIDDLAEIAGLAAEREGGAGVAPLGDLDGDGLPELAVRMRAFGSSEDRWDGVAILPGAVVPLTGTLSVADHLLVEGEVTELEPCDLDGDGLPELVTSAGIWAGTDLLSPGAPPIAGGFPGPLACLGDLDGDGRSELAWGDPMLPRL